MGLTAVRSILQAHHADISFDECAEGAVIRLDFRMGLGRHRLGRGRPLCSQPGKPQTKHFANWLKEATLGFLD